MWPLFFIIINHPIMPFTFSQLLDKVNAHIESLDYAREPMRLYTPVKYILSRRQAYTSCNDAYGL